MSKEEEFHQWLITLNLDEYASVFSENDIDFNTIEYLSDSDLKELGLSLGHRRVLMAAISARSSNLKNLVIPDTPSSAPPSVSSERRQLTVVFCDLVGSTELAQNLDPEDLLDVLGHYRNSVANAIKHYQGHIAQYMGDGVLAYFGWPTAFEDQAERAVRAGLDAIAAVKELELGNDITIQSRVGIETGEVVVGEMVSDVVRDIQSATGETPNRAARLQGMAKPDQLVIGSNTHALLGTVFELESLGEHKLKGYTQSEPVWAVSGISGVGSRFEAARGAILHELVGRTHELDIIQTRWRDAQNGQGRTILLCGEGGIGKSRLVRDFCNDAVDHQSTINLQCSPHHASNAFYPIIQQTLRAADIGRQDSNDRKLDKLEHALGEIGEKSSNTAALFASLLSIEGQERYGALELTPQQLRARTIDAIIDQIVRVSERHPTLVIIEDVHWIDPSTSSFVEALIDRVADHRILLLVTYRPQNAPKWSMLPGLTKIELNPLNMQQAVTLANEIAGSDLGDEIIRNIVQRAEGVPLYVEELTKSVLESVETGDRSIPVSLQSSLVARLDRLGAAKDLAQIGSVIGREFSLDLLVALSHRSLEEVSSGLEALLKSELVHTLDGSPDSKYSFKHALVQDAAYGTILVTRRRQLHGTIVELLESRSDRPSTESIHLLGHHAFQASMPDKAFRYLIEAGTNAMNRAEIHEAVAQYERALQAEAQLETVEESKEKAIDLRFELRNALWNIGKFKKILTHLDDAENLCTDISDDRRAGWVSVFRGASYWQLGQSKEAIDAARTALSINEKSNDLSLGVGANFYLGCAYTTSGDYESAEKRYAEIVKTTEGELKYDRCGLAFVPSICARSWLVWLMAERGEFDRGAQLGQEALEIALEIDNPWNLAHIYYDLGYFHAIRGEHQQALDAQEKAFNFITEWNLTYLAPFIGGFLGHAYALTGQNSKAISTLQQALKIYETMGLGLFRSLITIHYAEALMLAGDLEEAKQVGQGGLQLATDRREPGHQCHAHRVLGLIALKANDSFQAKQHFDKALELSKRLDMNPFVAHSYLGLAQTAHSNGELELSKKYVDQADNLYSEMGMDYWHEQSAAFAKEVAASTCSTA